MDRSLRRVERDFRDNLRSGKAQTIKKVVVPIASDVRLLSTDSDDARLATLFLAVPVSWKGTLQQHVGYLHRLHDSRRVVQVYECADDCIPMLARMFERRSKGYSAIGYSIDRTTPALLP